jgi:hypothetical protein
MKQIRRKMNAEANNDSDKLLSKTNQFKKNEKIAVMNGE